MDYNLNGKRRAHAVTTLQHVTYRRWKVQLNDFDALAWRGKLEPSMWELLAHVLRPHLPSDVLLRQPHVLRSQKTGDEHLPKNVTPRVKCSHIVLIQNSGLCSSW